MNLSSIARRRGFTLVELLIVITIISILAAMATLALAGAAEEGRRARARTQVSKIDQLISEKWNSYRFRQVPIRVGQGVPAPIAARIRLNALRELMRVEMPDRLTDVLDPPVVLTTRPSLQRAYQRKVSAAAATTLSFDQAECLYLILSEMRDGDRSALNFFMTSEVGDVDGDGMNEILDPWGMPIMYLRWAPGFSRATINDQELVANPLAPPLPQIDIAVATMQIPSGNIAPDPFDPLKVDIRWSDPAPGALRPFLLRPLIFSAGPDKQYDIYIDPRSTTFRYAATTPPNDPYAYVVDAVSGNKWMGMPVDPNEDGLNHGDNITNHDTVLQGE